MTMTRAQMVAMARELADAVDSPRWSDANIQQLLGLHHWTEWGKLLNAFNQLKMNGPITVTQDSDGRFDWSDLTTGSGNDIKHAYRVHTLGNPSGGADGTSGPLFYREVRYVRYPNPQPSTALPYVWYRFGDEVQVLPANAGQQMQAVVNWRPCRIQDLADDDDDVDFPDGYEMLIPYLAGASMLDKGGAEAGAANVLIANADGVRADMMLDLGRMSIAPIVAGAFDNPSDWGSGGAY